MAVATLLLCAAFCLATLPAYAADEAVTPEGCDFAITGGGYSFDSASGVLTITGDATVAMADGVEQTAQRIVVAGDATVTLDGIDIQSTQGPAILIESPHSVELVLADGSENTVVGSSNKAGVEVEFEFEDGDSPSNTKASLTISGSGTLNATGGKDSAGIGGSRSGSRGNGLYGDITINGGTINARGTGGGAGIGSSNNPGGSSGSYKQTGNNVWGTITINGGTVNAVAENQGAGIGGGNHVDSSKIIINDGTVTAHGAAGIGCGIGSSKNVAGTSSDKGPGYYFADVEINGGNITASSNDIGAAIGGGMYCDALVKITGGTIDATGGSRQGNTHHGGAGIGGGYLGHADIEITGGNITARGGDGASGIGSGGSPNANELRGVNGRSDAMTTVKSTDVEISGGDIKAYGGPQGGAGIGLGVGADKGSVSISGGTVHAEGAPSDEETKHGGAGIGSAFQGTGTGSDKYFVPADIDVSITGGDVVAIGGWGASGIGSGAENKMANNIEIDAYNASIQAYADGTKFAIDTRILNDDGTTSSQTEGRDITGDILQGTFVHAGEIGDYEQNPEGLPSIIVTNDVTGTQKELTHMPAGYRSYATDVEAPGPYTVYTDADSIGRGEGRYFSHCTTDVWAEENVDENNVQYSVKTGELSDNFYLFPVKSIVVEKRVRPDDSVAEEDQQITLENVNATFYFALHRKGDPDDELVKTNDGELWLTSIEVVDGVPQSEGFFVNIQDATYDLWEVDEQGNRVTEGTVFDSVVLTRITTAHGDDETNNASIDDDVWTDKVAVINSFELAPEGPDDPDEYDEPDDPSGDPVDDGDDPGDDGDDPSGSPADDGDNPSGDSKQPIDKQTADKTSANKKAADAKKLPGTGDSMGRGAFAAALVLTGAAAMAIGSLRRSRRG